MLVILARSARYMKLLPFSSDNARSGARRGALAESSRAGRTGRERFVAGFRKAYGGRGPLTPGRRPVRGAAKVGEGVAGDKGEASDTRGRPPPSRTSPLGQSGR